jgi:hypothetical protein
LALTMPRKPSSPCSQMLATHRGASLWRFPRVRVARLSGSMGVVGEAEAGP